MAHHVIKRTASFLVVFATVYALLGITTEWIAVAWLDSRIGDPSGGFEVSRTLQGILVFQSFSTLTIGLMLGRVIVAPWLRSADVRRIVVVSIATAVCAMGPLIALSVPLRGRDLHPGDTDLSLLLSQAWMLIGPGVSAVLLMWFTAAAESPESAKHA
jgi:hypothetical protein